MAGIVESLEKAVAKLHRKRIARRVFALSNGLVTRGPFRGMVLSRESHLSRSDMALKAFGLYEPEVLETMTGWDPLGTLVNFGAGDGYYSIGLLRAGIVRRALSFELNPQGRKVILDNAALNGVAPAVQVFGAAEGDVTGTLVQEGVDPASLIILCDIEGAEFSVIHPGLIRWAAQSRFVIELHPFMFPDGEAKIQSLLRDFAATHHCRILKAGPPRWQGIAEIEALTDLERALVTNEGRKQLGRWLVAEPRSEAAGSA